MFQEDEMRFLVNSYCETPLLRNGVIGSPSLYASCPNIVKLLVHAFGDSESAMLFVNWLAWIVQTGSRAGTSWILHGHSESGGHLLHKRIMAPLYGAHAIQFPFDSLARQFKFNDWMHSTIMVDVDCPEDFWTSSKYSGFQVATEQNLLLKPPGRSSYFQPSRLNFVFRCRDGNEPRLPEHDTTHFVATKQPESLFMKHPELAFVATDPFKHEMPYFADVLLSMDAVREQALVPNRNQARLRAISDFDAEMDLFCRALAEADLTYFERVMRLDPRAAKDNLIGVAQNIVMTSIHLDALRDMRSVFTLTELRTVFQTVFDHAGSISMPEWKRALAERALVPRSLSWQREGDKTRTGIAVRWHFNDAFDFKALFKHHFDKFLFSLRNRRKP